MELGRVVGGGRVNMFKTFYRTVKLSTELIKYRERETEIFIQ